MDPKIDDLYLNNDVLKFTLSNINVTIANTIRRTILSDIDTYVFKTYPYNECDAEIEINTTRFNNEILKQRLSCIPIHSTDPDLPIDNLLLVVDMENNTNEIQYVTTEHFKIYDTTTKTFMPSSDISKMFPPNNITKQYIDFVRLRPKISSEIPGEYIKLTCKISKSNAKEDSMFNVACNSSYGFTRDKDKIDKVWNETEKQLIKDETSTEDIEYAKKDFYNLDCKKYYIANSFDFTIQTVGIYTCYELVQKACQIIYNSFDEFKKDIDSLQINVSDTTINNCFDICLFYKDHTFGKCMEYLLYSKFYEGEERLSYCGFMKKHPHDNYCIVRIAYKEEVDRETIIKDIITVCDAAIVLFKNMEQLFIE